jgi:hypothetical protein
VDGISVPSTSEVTQITEFVNEACDQVSIRAAASKPLAEMYTDVSSVNDLKQYFSRPIQIDNLTYNQPARGLITSYRLSTGETKLRVRNFDRISGCYGWRATFCFRLQSIATPQQAGRLRMAFQPFKNALDHNRITSITPISQLPGVDLDIIESTSAILKVPFIFNRNYFNYQTVSGDELGEVAIFAYTPVALAAGAFSPRIAVWHWLEDFEMIAAAPEAITLIAAPAAAAAKFSEVVDPPLLSPFETVPLATILEAQAGKFSASAREEKAIPGNLSNVLAAGSKLVTWAGTKIPFISSYSGPTSWMMREAAKIAASYGWSKPLNATPANRMLQTVNTYQTNMDGADTTFSLGAAVDNAVQPLPGFAGTDVDEMSIDYVKSVYSAISQPVLSQFDPPGDLVYSCSLSPKAMFFQDGIQNSVTPLFTPNLAFRPSSVFGIANCFNMFRGGFKFRIKISKTKFHTGRLLLGFTPVRASVVAGTFVPTSYESLDFKSVIWDLREGNVMEFEVPFISENSWLDINESFGTFHISVVDPLVGPETVSFTAPFVVEVAGADDLEFAFVNTPEFWPAPANSVFSAQSGLFEPYSSDRTTDHAANCIGEKINSVKQLLSKANFISSGLGDTTAFSRVVTQPTWVAGTGGLLRDVVTSWRGYFNFFYGLERGGICYHATPYGKDMVISATVSYLPGVNSMIANTSHSETATALHVKVPYFSNFSRNITGGVLDVPATVVTFRTSDGPATNRLAVQERAADDFQFGYYMGPPPLVSGTSPDLSLGTSLVNNGTIVRT